MEMGGDIFKNLQSGGPYYSVPNSAGEIDRPRKNLI